MLDLSERADNPWVRRKIAIKGRNINFPPFFGTFMCRFISQRFSVETCAGPELNGRSLDSIRDSLGDFQLQKLWAFQLLELI